MALLCGVRAITQKVSIFYSGYIVELPEIFKFNLSKDMPSVKVLERVQ